VNGLPDVSSNDDKHYSSSNFAVKCDIARHHERQVQRKGLGESVGSDKQHCTQHHFLPGNFSKQDGVWRISVGPKLPQNLQRPFHHELLPQHRLPPFFDQLYALPITSALRFRPWGPLGMVVMKQVEEHNQEYGDNNP
jgi:hypothetical protein